MAQVLSAATIVAKHTSALCNACRLASSKTTNPAAKRHFVQSAKEVANSTANLVKTIKVEWPDHQPNLHVVMMSVSSVDLSFPLYFTVCLCPLPGFRWRFLRWKQEQLSCRHVAANWSRWKFDYICLQPRVCQRPCSNQPWGTTMQASVEQVDTVQIPVLLMYSSIFRALQLRNPSFSPHAPCSTVPPTCWRQHARWS